MYVCMYVCMYVYQALEDIRRVMRALDKQANTFHCGVVKSNRYVAKVVVVVGESGNTYMCTEEKLLDICLRGKNQV